MNEAELSLWRNFMERGTQCLGEEQYLEAEKYYSQGLQKAYQITVPEIVAFTLRLLATVRVRLENLDLAEKDFQEALRICQDIRNAKGMAEAWAGLASVSVKKGMLQKAGKEYQQAISVYPSTSPPLRLAMLYADLGQVFAALEDWINAKDTYTQSQELCRSNGFPKGEADLDVFLAELHLRQGRKTEALRYLRHACRIFACIADSTALANTLQYLALLDFEQNNLHEAFKNQHRALALSLKYDQKNLFSENCYFLSKIIQYLGSYEEAKYYLQLSIEFHSGQDLELAIRYQCLAGLFFRTLDYSSAEIYYLKALIIFEALHDKLRIIEVYEALTFLAEKQEYKEKRLNNRDKSDIKIGHKYQDKAILFEELTLEALVRLAEFYEKRQNYRYALECYWKALGKGREAETATNWIEIRVQRVSLKLRKKK